MKNQEEWWEPVWKSLVMDKEGRHYRAMGSALWLFLYLIINADRKRGTVIRNVKTIASDTGIKERTLRDWLKTLKEGGYIKTRIIGRSLLIHILWTSYPEWQRNGTQSDRSLHGRVAEFCKAYKALKGLDSAHLRQKRLRVAESCDPDDISIRNIFNIDIGNIEDKKNLGSDLNALKGFKPKTRQKLLALDLARELDDYQALLLYISYARKYPEALLRRVAGEVKEIPIEKIKKSRGALFNYLIQKYLKDSTKNPNH